MNLDIVTLLKIAGIGHIGIIAAGALMPKAVNLKSHIKTLPAFIGRLFWVYYAFIGLCLLSFGLGTFFLAEQLAAGTSLARAVCGFLTAFWLLRLVAAIFIFDVKPYLTRPILMLGYQATNVAFILLPALYAWAAIKQ